MDSKTFFAVLVAAFVCLVTVVSPSYAQLALGNDVVVITAPDGASINGQICNHSTEDCVAVSEVLGTARVPLSLESGDIVGFSGMFDEQHADFVEVFAPRSSFDWLERAALVLAGAVAGLIGNVLMAWYTDKRKDHVEQRSKFRSWRDSILKNIKDRSTDEGVKLSTKVPEGLSKKTSLKIQDMEDKLSAIEKKLHAKPDELDKLLGSARKLVSGSSL